jgi:hypothetical protein
MGDDALAARLTDKFPDLPDYIIADLITQAKAAIAGAYELQSQLLVVPNPIVTSWGYDPNLASRWAINVVMFTEAPSSFWTRMAVVEGETIPSAMTQAEAIAFLLQDEPPPNTGNPYPERTDGAGLHDEIPSVAIGNRELLENLSDEAATRTAPGWFQIAWDAAKAAGVQLGQYGSRFAAVIAGVFSNVRGV